MRSWKKTLSVVALAFALTASATGCSGSPEPVSTVDAAEIQRAKDTKEVNAVLAKFFTSLREEMRERNKAPEPAPISETTFPMTYSHMDKSIMHEEDIVAYIDKYGTMFANMPDGDMSISEAAVSVVANEAILEEGSIIISAGAVRRGQLAGVNLMLQRYDNGNWLISDQVPEHEHVH